MSTPKYHVPQPERVRRINGSFAWIDHRLLRGGFLSAMTPQDQSLYLLLALAADRNGVSFYRLEKMADVLGLALRDLQVARDRLIELGLLAFEPYSALSVNGFHQVMAVPERAPDLLARAAAQAPAAATAATASAPGGGFDLARAIAGMFK